MRFNKKLIFVVPLTLFLMACGQVAKESDKEPVEELVQEEVKTHSLFLGNYVTDGYFEREKGHDWVAVSVKQADGEDLLIFVSSREDIKKPTCTFESIAKKLNDSVYVATVDEKNILFTFSETMVEISVEKAEDVGILSFFCSGGGTLAGRYTKTND